MFGMVNCYEMSHCLYSELVELIVIVQAQHINNRKYSNSYTTDDDRKKNNIKNDWEKKTQDSVHKTYCYLI
jgi:hypothetical protein